MKLFSIVFSLVLFLSFIPAFADCSKEPGKPNDIDKDCITKCKAVEGGGFTDGCYLPPETDTCEDFKYKPHPDEQLCCCK